MAKSTFLFFVTMVHALVGCVASFLCFASVFNMCGPAHPATPFTYVSGVVAVVMFCPIALPTFWLLDLLNQWSLMPVGILLNSYLWAMGLWHLSIKLKSRHR